MPKRKKFPTKGVEKFYLMHGESLGDVLERAQRSQRGASSEPAQFARPIEHEDGTVEFPDDPEYDRRDWEFGEYGFPDDGHDYSQYFRPIGQSQGVFVAADGSVSKAVPLSAQYTAPTLIGADGEGSKQEGDEDVKKKVTKKMIKEGEFLLRDEEGQREKSADNEKDEDDDKNGEKVVVLGVPFVVQEQDDFETQKELHYKTMEKPDADLEKVLDAKDGAEEVGGVHIEEMPDDFIQQLMQSDGEEEEEEYDDDEYYDDEEEGEEQISRRPEGDPLAGMEEQFDEVLKEYDSDDIGDLSGDEGTCGTMSVQEILAHLEAEETKEVGRLVRMRAAGHVLSGPLVDHQYKDDEDDEGDGDYEEETVLEDGTRVKKLKHRKNKKLMEMLSVATEALDEEERRKVIALLEKAEREGPKKVAVEVPDDDERDERWDCESVLSTLSTTSNAPSVIEDEDDDESSKRKQRAKKGPTAQPIIQLSKKTGMPVEVLREQQQQQNQATSGKKKVKKNLGEARKEETAEEKRARKKAVKQAAREKRMQKKQLKVAYKEAESKQARTIQAQAHSLGGQSVIHM